MRLWLLGVRGSTPAPGPDFVRYGGHTSCVAVVPAGGDEPTLLLDAGTGIRALTARMRSGVFRGSILLSHLHWDHVEGIPFCRAVDAADARVDLYVPEQCGASARDLLARTMSPPSFPIEPEGMNGTWRFLGAPDTATEIEGFRVSCCEVAHKGGRTLGYRVEDERGSVAYLPDHAPSYGMTEAARALVRGVDVLLHDAQFLETERPVAEAYGHATVEETIALAAELEVGMLVLFHHSPVRTDAELDAIAGSAASVAPAVPVVVAREGVTIPVGEAL